MGKAEHRAWSVNDLGDTGGYRDIIMHRHARHDITLMQENESGEWSGWLRGHCPRQRHQNKDKPSWLSFGHQSPRHQAVIEVCGLHGLHRWRDRRQ